MKNPFTLPTSLQALLVTTLTVATLAAPSISQALVRQIANCTTPDGKFQVLILDNEGIGSDRTPNISATIQDSSGQTVATYLAEKFQGVQSASFGRSKFQDSATKGQRFELDGPSTNLHRFDLKADIDGRTYSALGLDCSVFDGEVVQN